MSNPFSQATGIIRGWHDDPRRFVRECLCVEPDAWQDEVLEAATRHQRIALKASKGPGKSTALAWLCWWFLLTRPHPKIAATSITGDNLRDNLWSELSKWQKASPLLQASFTWTESRVFANDHPETWFCTARQWARTASPQAQGDTLAGLHADHVLFLVDEAGGVPDAVLAAAEGGLANSEPGSGREAILAIAGNPSLTSGPLYRACTRDRRLWWVKEISGDPDDPNRAPRVSIKWAREMIEKYGRDNPIVMVSVLGKFPPGQSNTLIGVELATEASKRVYADRVWQDEVRILGVDVARFGDDRTVLARRQGKACLRLDVFNDLDTMQVAGQVALVIQDTRWTPDAVFIDETGIGTGVVDRLHQLGYRGLVFGVNNAGKPVAERDVKFLNRRAEMWWGMSEWLKRGGRIPNDGELIGELTAPTYWFNRDNRLQIESKDDLKARGEPSPDKADALGLTFAAPVAHRALRELQDRGRRVTHDYNPFGQRS